MRLSRSRKSVSDTPLASIRTCPLAGMTPAAVKSSSARRFSRTNCSRQSLTSALRDGLNRRISICVSRCSLTLATPPLASQLLRSSTELPTERKRSCFMTSSAYRKLPRKNSSQPSRSRCDQGHVTVLHGTPASPVKDVRRQRRGLMATRDTSNSRNAGIGPHRTTQGRWGAVRDAAAPCPTTPPMQGRCPARLAGHRVPTRAGPSG